MKLVVFGANGPTGQLLTRQALAEGHAVTAVTRHPEAFHSETPVCRYYMETSLIACRLRKRLPHSMPSSQPWCALQPQTDHPVLPRHGPYRVGHEGYGVRRLVCVSSSGVDPHPGLGGFFFRKVLQPFFIGVVGRTLYADLKRMETLVGNSNLTGQTWRTSCSSNSPMTSTCTRLWRWRHARERPTSICSLEEGISKKPSSSKGVPPQGHRRCNAPARAIDQ